MSDQSVADKLAIRDVLSKYCRGLDRMDKEMAYSVFSADCSVHYYDMFEGSGHGFVDWVWEAHAAMDRHSHQINNALIAVDGNTAVSEAYVTVVLWTAPPDITEITCRGRYLDRWEKRADSWQIVRREHVLDTQSLNGVPVPDAVNQQSRRDDSDPSFKFIPRA
ncbi:MAG: nuclear transport factor 2 family protein [Gammaproteobacteria bacterium]|nr:nuclear transport factor 2 family protein [Gammaproteobacteria bacterium]